MIVIKILLMLAVCFLHGGNFCEAADIQEGRIAHFLRRRTGSQVKKGPDMPMISGATSGQIEDSSKKFIEFNLRTRTKSNDKTASTSTSTITGALMGFFSSAVKEIGKTLDAIDNLEMAYDAAEQSRQAQEKEQNIPTVTIRRDSNRPRIVNQLLRGAFSEFEDSESDNCNTESSGDCNKKGSKSDGSDSSGEYISENNDDSIIDSNIVEKSCRDPMLSSTLKQKNQKSSVDSFVAESGFHDKKPFEDETSIVPSALKLSSQAASVDADEIQQQSYRILSDSDSDSWEKIEFNMIENVQVLVKKPSVSQFVLSFGKNQHKLVDLLSTVFVKFALKFFFKPQPTISKQTKTESFEDFVSEFDEIISQNYVDLSEDGTKKHKFLDFETAYRILFYDDAHDCSNEWDLCIILPSKQDFVDAIEHVSRTNPHDLVTIEKDLPRLSFKFYDFYAESKGRGPLATDGQEVTDNVRSVLAFIMAFESKEVSSVPKESCESPSTSSKNRPITYFQGFDSIAAYFAINFDLECAGPLAYRFFQLYMSELFNAPNEDVRAVVRKIDSRAANMVRAYLRDQVNGAYVLNFEILTGILEAFPFSDHTASVLYTTSATTWTDLDRLFQFLLLKVPQSQAYKSISLLAAANMLFSMLSLEKLFKDELLGSDRWTDLKEQLNQTTCPRQRRTILDSLAYEFMGYLFLLLKDKIVHAGDEFNEFLKVAESLVPYLYECN